MSASPYKTVLDVGATLTADLDLEEVFARIARQVGEALDAGSCDINAYDPTADTLTYVAVWAKHLRPEDEDHVGTVVSLADRPARRDVLQGHDVVETYLDDPDLDPVERASMQEYDEHASLEAPLVYGDEVIGVLGIVDSVPGRRFTDDEKELLKALAVPAAVAIHNARVFGAAAARRRQLASLLDAGKAITSSFGLEDVLQTVAREAAQLLGCAECLIFEYDAERRALVWRTRYEHGSGHVWQDALGTAYPVEDWLEDHALMLSGGLRLHHADDLTLTDGEREYLLERDMRTALTVSLRFGDEPIGLLYLVEFDRRRDFSKHELELATACGELASAAIHSATLLRRQERQSERLVGLFDASRSMATALTVDDVVRAVHEEVAGAMLGEESVVRVWLHGDDGRLAIADAPLEGADAHPDATMPSAAARALAALAPVQEQADGGARLAVPLVLRGRAEGLIDVVSGRRAYGDDMVELFQIVANQAAAAVANARLYARFANQAITDGLTGLFNHRYFHERLEQECARACRYGLPLSLLMIDIDDFKQFNDRHGHLLGDQVLREVGVILRAGIRRGVDLPARYGGEEFAVILPHTEALGAGVVGGRIQRQVAALLAAAGPGEDDVVPPPGESAVDVGERLRRDVEERAAYVVPRAVVTVSIGIASIAAGELPCDELVHRADKALYVAKRAGKNRVELYA